MSDAADLPSLIQRLSALAVDLRPQILADVLQDLNAEDAARLIEAAVQRQQGAGPQARVVIDALMAARNNKIVRESYIFAWRIEAQRCGLDAAVVVLAPSTAGAEKVAPRERPAEKGVTLGHRRARARTATGDELKTLLLDPDPIVVARALENARVTEEKVIRLVAQRQVAPEILRVVMRSRFRQRADVMRAVAMSPAADPALAASILPALPKSVLRAFAHDMALQPKVREGARALVEGA